MSDRAQNFVCGLDVGTTKICAVVASIDLTGDLSIAAVGTVPAAGIDRGIVVDMDAATGAIKEAVRLAQEAAGVPVYSVYLGLTGAHISCVNVRGRAYVTGPQVGPSDIEEAISSARDSVPLTSDRRILQHTVREFVLDGERGIRRPLGMVGRQLDVNLHVVTGRASIVDTLVAAAEAAGLSVAAVALEAQATAAAVLTEAEQKLGCIILDIGGGTTDLAVFADGAICYTAAIPVAGNRVTMDIARVLRIAPEEAERVKREHGHALPEEVGEDEMIEVVVVGTEERREVPRRLLAEIIQARMQEIFEAVAERLTTERLWSLAPAGVVLSGGGSELAATARLATTILRDLPARVGAPRGIKGRNDLVAEPMYSTGVGLAQLAAAERVWCTTRPGRPIKPAVTLRRLWNAFAQRALETWHRISAHRR
ncbi:MAG: cell division protein FtsA [Armatimonadetes bacterium]|nr:cell division protein FtsA [Armatimonadota bacterium]